jgi:hypothetical protein
MSGLIDKAKEAITSHSHKNDTTTTHGATTHHGASGYDTTSGSTNAGPHNSNLANKMDPRIDSDRDNRNDPTSRIGGYGTQDSTTGAGYGSGTTGTGYGPGNTAGPHSSNVANKLDPRVDSDLDGRGVGHGSSNYGPHSSNIANKADPRVDSDLDGRGAGYGSSNYGPHSSNIANKADPRVDSDLDGRGAGHGSSNYGPHSSNIANKLDPRVDSDLDGRGVGHGSSNYGPHSSNIANKADPRVDSDLDGRGTGHGHSTAATGTHAHNVTTTGGYGSSNYGSSQTPGSGDANKTAGPHNSNLLNKLDPRVDSDMDGSKTYGGNKTFQ